MEGVVATKTLRLQVSSGRVTDISPLSFIPEKDRGLFSGKDLGSKPHNLSPLGHENIIKQARKRCQLGCYLRKN